MNLLNEADIQETLQRFRPCAVIHCAAERFPNKVEENLEEVKKLNVRASEILALEAGMNSKNCSLSFSGF